MDSYDNAAKLWQLLHRDLLAGLKDDSIEYKSTSDDEDNEDSGDDFSTGSWDDDDEKDEKPLRLRGKKGAKNFVLTYFWGAHQRFFRDFCIACKVPAAIKAAKTALENGMSVVIGLQSTGGSASERDCERSNGSETGTDLISTPELTVKRYS